MGLLSKLLGRSRGESHEPRDVRIELPHHEDKHISGEYYVPSSLKENGMYAIQISQAEMYDLGNIKFIPHFILYDRKNRVAIDITSDIRPAPLLSQTRPAEVLGEEAVDFIEQYLNGKTKPEYTEHLPQGIKLFRADEMNGRSYNLRERTIALKSARATLDTAIENFRRDAISLGREYFPKEESKSV